VHTLLAFVLRVIAAIHLQRLFGKQLGDVSSMVVSSLHSQFTSQLAAGKQGILVEKLKAEIVTLHASISARDEALAVAQVNQQRLIPLVCGCSFCPPIPRRICPVRQ
jgi:hypothetical protein